MPRRRRTPPPLSRVEFLQHCPNDVLFAILGHLLDPVSPRAAAFFASTCKDARAFSRSALTELKGDAHAVRSFYKVVRRANKLTKLSKLSSRTRLNARDVLENNHLAQQGLWIACARGLLANLKWLTLTGNQIGDEGMHAFSSALAKGALPNLKELNLLKNEIGDAGVSALADACARGALERLLVLDLRTNQVGDAGCIALATACASGALANLTELHLFQNQIGDAGITALASACASRALASIAFIDLDRNKATETGKKAMRDVANARKFRVDLA